MATRRSASQRTREIRDGGMHGKRILISFTDVTDFKRSAKQLDAAKQVAEQANLAKSRFLATESHDLRQPLQALKLLLGGAEQRIKDQQVRAVLARMGRILESMADILTALLDSNRLETGAIHPTWSNFPIKELFGVTIPILPSEMLPKRDSCTTSVNRQIAAR